MKIGKWVGQDGKGYGKSFNSIFDAIVNAKLPSANWTLVEVVPHPSGITVPKSLHSWLLLGIHAGVARIISYSSKIIVDYRKDLAVREALNMAWLMAKETGIIKASPTQLNAMVCAKPFFKLLFTSERANMIRGAIARTPLALTRAA